MRAGGSGDTVRLRAVADADLDQFFADQADPHAAAMAGFSPRSRETFDAHWHRASADPQVVLRTVLVGESVAGNVVSWEQDGHRLVGYWISRHSWGRGIATRALELFVEELVIRPLYAHVAAHNLASLRVLRKCGFQRDFAAETLLGPPEDDVPELILILTDSAGRPPRQGHPARP